MPSLLIGRLQPALFSAAMALVLAVATQAGAQDAGPALPRPWHEPLQSTPALPSSQWPAISEPAPPVCQYEHWVVSTRGCDQLSCFDPRRDCRLRYFRCDADECPRPERRETFHQWLQPGVPIVVVVHGSFTEWETVCEDTKHTSRWLRNAAPGQPVQFVYFTWPSEGLVTLLPCVDFGMLGRKASVNGLYLARLVAELPPDTPVTFLGHSLGCRVIASCLHLMGGGTIETGDRFPAAPADRRRLRAVFAAAAIDHHWLLPGERFGCALPRAELIVNLRNQDDLALAIYPLRRPFSHRALGRSGATSKDRRLLGGLSSKLIEFDVTHCLGGGHVWPRYYSRPGIARAIAPYAFYADAFGTPHTTPSTLGHARQPQPADPGFAQAAGTQEINHSPRPPQRRSSKTPPDAGRSRHPLFRPSQTRVMESPADASVNSRSPNRRLVNVGSWR